MRIHSWRKRARLETVPANNDVGETLPMKKLANEHLEAVRERVPIVVFQAKTRSGVPRDPPQMKSSWEVDLRTYRQPNFYPLRAILGTAAERKPA